MLRKTASSVYAAFFSHASQDAAIVDQVARALRDNQLAIWVDASDIAFGGLLRQELQIAIQKSHTLVLDRKSVV